MRVGHVYVFLGEISVHVFCPIHDWIVCFFGVEFNKFFIDLGTSPLSDRSFANIFSHSVGCLLLSLTVSFAVQKLLTLMKSQEFIFAFVSFAFVDVSCKKFSEKLTKEFEGNR